MCVAAFIALGYDFLAASLCATGICVGFFADNQLYEYMNLPKKPILLETGLWRYSRHPNHFGEQTWWIGLLCFAVAAAGGPADFAASGMQGVCPLRSLQLAALTAGLLLDDVPGGICLDFHRECPLFSRNFRSFTGYTKRIQSSRRGQSM